MKKHLVLIIALCILITMLAACNENPDLPVSDTDTEAITKETADVPTHAPSDTHTDVSTEEASTQGESESTTESGNATEMPTESETPSQTETPSETETKCESESETESDAETDPYVEFIKYTVKGSGSSALKDAINAANLPSPSAGTGKDIYVGEHSSALSQNAAALITRPNNYHDFAILTNGDDLAIWAGSDGALERAIAYLIDNYTKGGYIAVPHDFSYVDMTHAVKDITIANKDLSEFTVTSSKNNLGLATKLTEDIAILTGYKLNCTAGANGTVIELATVDTSTEVDTSYTLSCESSALTLTAKNQATLSYAIADFLVKLENGLDISEGFSQSYPFAFKTAEATDTALFKYCGTWQATDKNNPTTMVSYWDAAYVEIDFTGDAITLMFSSASSFKYSIDGGEYKNANNVTGDFTVSASGNTTHTVRILQDDKAMHIYFAGVKSMENVTLSRTSDKKYYIQFIGDSISDDIRSFAHNSPELLGWDYSVTACQGISLVRDWGSWKVLNGYSNSTASYTEGSIAWHFNQKFGVKSVGMEDAFFKLGIPHQKFPAADSDEFKDIVENYYTEKYDFDFNTGNTPDIVFIFLGTNDLGFNSGATSINTFKERYKNFVAKIFELYGEDTQIVIMQAVSTSVTTDLYNTNCGRYNGIRATANELMALYPDNVTFLDEAKLLSWNVEISPDGTHPSANGYATLSTKIAQWLDEKFK